MAPGLLAARHNKKKNKIKNEKKKSKIIKKKKYILMISTSTMYVCERVGIQMTTYLIETHTYIRKFYIDRPHFYSPGRIVVCACICKLKW